MLVRTCAVDLEVLAGWLDDPEARDAGQGVVLVGAGRAAALKVGKRVGLVARQEYCNQAEASEKLLFSINNLL